MMWIKSDENIWERAVGYIKDDSEGWMMTNHLGYKIHTQHHEDDEEVFPGPEDYETDGRWYEGHAYNDPDIGGN